MHQFYQNLGLEVNVKKTKVMIFNKSRKYDFPPEFHFRDGNILECLEETKLLGILLSSSLKWDSNTNAICKNAKTKLWLLRRLRTVKVRTRKSPFTRTLRAHLSGSKRANCRFSMTSMCRKLCPVA